MKNILKYMLLTVFAFVQVQAFAFNNSSDLWKKVSLKEETNWLLFGKINNIESDNIVYFFVDGQYFSLTSVLDNNNDICYSGNANSRRVIYTLRNKTNSSISPKDAITSVNDGNKLQLIGQGISVSNLNFNSTTHPNASISITPNMVQNLNLAPNGTFVFSLPFSSSENEVVTGTLTIRYGTAGSSYSVGESLSNNAQILEQLSVTNTIYRRPNTPNAINKNIHPHTTYTLQTAAGLQVSGLENRKFYKDNVEVEPTAIISQSNLTGYTYTNFDDSKAQCKESLHSPINFTLFTGPFPQPGTIVAEKSTICFGGTAKINNVTLGSYSGSALKYTWEISYDDGITWGAPDDTSGADVDGANFIEITNVTSKIKVRRKAHRRPTTLYELTYSYTTPVTINVVKNNIIFPEGISNSVSVIMNPTTQLGEVMLPVVTASISGSTIIYKNRSGQTPSILATNPSPGTVSNPNYISVGSLPKGEYLFEIEVTNTINDNQTCTANEFIKVLVYDAADCNVYTKRTFATLQNYWSSGFSGVAKPNQAVPLSGAVINRANAATLTGGVVLLGIGTVGIDLYFTNPETNQLYSGADLRGKKVVVKLGEQYSGLKVAGGISVIPRLTRPGVTASQIQAASSTVNQGTALPPYLADNNGKTVGVKGGVLDALKGDNVFEFSFVPTNLSNGLIDFNGVRIQLGSLIGVADLASVFYAYIEEEGQIVNSGAVSPNINRDNFCSFLSNAIVVSPPSTLLYPKFQNDVTVPITELGPISNENITLNPFIEDAFWGNYSEVLNVASALSSVVYPYYAVDNDYESYALFNATAGVLNRQFLKAKLKQNARLGDQVQITLAYPNINVLNLSLLQLGNFKVIYYLNGAIVGEERLEQFRVLDIGLFNFRDKRRAILSKPVNFMFDAIELQQFNTVSVNLGDGLHVHDIRINPLRAFNGMTDPKQVTKLCATSPLQIQKPDACTSYTVSLARVTEYGPEYMIDENTPLLDYNGQPIKSIYEIEDIANSTLIYLGEDQSGRTSLFDLNISELFVGNNYDNKMLVKIQTTRQGCNYGEPQYLRVNIVNCVEAIVNPVIKSGANY